MARERVSLSYGDFIPIPGDKKRRYVSPSTGEVIGVGQFQRKATRTPLPPKPAKQRVSQKPTKTPSNTKFLGGTVSTGDVSQHPITRIKQITRYEFSGPIGKPNPLARYNAFLNNYVAQINLEHQKYGIPPITRNQARQLEDFKYNYKNYKNVHDRARGGKRHQALIFFGILEEDDDYY
jgi:hypothetical protein